jgi:hypothetical protein
MYPSFFSTLTGTPAVTALLGSNPTRVYPHGEAPQTVAKPYVTHQLVTGLPENYLADTADMDTCRVQFNCYGATSASALSVASAIRTALEPFGYVVSMNLTGRDPDTNNYTYSFDMEFMSAR